MMIGHVRDNFPRLMLTLPGRNGSVNVEFVVDTGFDGELTNRLAIELLQAKAALSTVPICAVSLA